MRSNSWNLLYSPFRLRVMTGLAEAKTAGIPLFLFESHRSFARQRKLYEQGRSEPGNIVTYTKPGMSWHNYGIAVDLVLKINGLWTWEHRDLYLKAAPFFEKQGLKWLGRNPNFQDLVHYEMQIDQSINEIKEIHENGGIIEVWKKLDEQHGREFDV